MMVSGFSRFSHPGSHPLRPPLPPVTCTHCSCDLHYAHYSVHSFCRGFFSFSFGILWGASLSCIPAQLPLKTTHASPPHCHIASPISPSQQSAPNCALNCAAVKPAPSPPIVPHHPPIYPLLKAPNLTTHLTPNTNTHPSPNSTPMAKELAKQKTAAHFSQLHFTLHFSLSLHKFSCTRVYCTAKMGTHSEKKKNKLAEKCRANRPEDTVYYWPRSNQVRRTYWNVCPKSL